MKRPLILGADISVLLHLSERNRTIVFTRSKVTVEELFQYTTGWQCYDWNTRVAICQRSKCKNG